MRCRLRRRSSCRERRLPRRAANDGKDGGETLKGWGIGVSYSRPGDYFVRLDWARRIGLGKNASDAAKAKNRFWFMVGKVW